jgi:hypothetical protein
MRKENNIQWKRRQRGQSLAEAAIFMPVLLLLVVGLVEVSQLVITQNRISTAARNAARFGAQGGEDAGIRNITLNTVTQTLDLTSGVWDIFVVRAQIGQDGNIDADDFDYQHVYGTGATQSFTATNTSAAWEALRQEIVDDLSFEGTDPAGLNIVGVLILHDVESILGLDLLPALLGRNTVRGFSIMRNSALATTVTQTSGCRAVYPLIAEVGKRSITPQDYEDLEFSYPSSPPAYESFANHVSQARLLDANEGYLYKYDVGTLTQNVGLVQWNNNITGINGGGSILATSLDYPGNSNDYGNHGDPGHSFPVYRGFSEWGDPTDREMHVGDRVPHSGETLNSSVRARLRDHIDSGRTLRLPLWDASTGGYDGSGNWFRIDGFGIFRIHGYGNDWILLEVFRLDSSCGQQ